VVIKIKAQVEIRNTSLVEYEYIYVMPPTVELQLGWMSQKLKNFFLKEEGSWWIEMVVGGGGGGKHKMIFNCSVSENLLTQHNTYYKVNAAKE